MFSNVMFFIYIFAAFIGFAVMAIIGLVAKHKKSSWSETVTAMFWFATFSFIVGVIYFINLYSGVVMEYYITGAVLRALDIGGFLALQLFWIKFIRATVRNENKQWNHGDLFWNTATLILLVTAVISYVVIPDGYYYVETEGLQIYMIVLQVILCAALPIFTLINLGIFLRRVRNLQTILYVSINSLLLIANGMWNGITTIGLFKGSLAITNWQDQTTDLTPLFIMAINILTLIFIMRHDFNPLYFAEDEDEVKRIGAIAEEGGLTKRETEVAELIYEGFTNDEIAEKLFISKNTVKHHVYNFYKKLGISTRIDFITLVKNRK